MLISDLQNSCEGALCRVAHHASDEGTNASLGSLLAQQETIGGSASGGATYPGSAS